MLEKHFTVNLDKIYLLFLVNKQSEKSLVSFVEVVKFYITIGDKFCVGRHLRNKVVLFQVLT